MEKPASKRGPDAEASSGEALATIGSTIVGRYRVESLLGEGGMGAVYLVTHTGIRKRLALKLLRAELMRDPKVVARFEREAMASAHLDHPNVVAASDYGRTEDGRYYLALEYVDGQRLRDVMEKAGGPLPPTRVFYIAHQITEALHRAHKVGIVHRDLKPENIMLVRRDEQDDFVKVLDFGLALVSRHLATEASEEHIVATAPKITQVGEIFGTPAYMAPEQGVGETVDIRADLYSLGIILYELLTGIRPFTGKSAAALIPQHLAVPPPAMKERAPKVSVPPPMEALVQRLLAKRPEDRYQTPEELLAAIEELATAHKLGWPGQTIAPVAEKREPPPRVKTPEPTSSGQPLSAVKDYLATGLQQAREKVLGKPTRRARIAKALAGVGDKLGKRLPWRRKRSSRKLVISIAAAGGVLLLGSVILWLALSG